MSPYGMASAILPAVRRPIGSQLSLNGLTDFEVKVVCLSAFTFSKAEAAIVRLGRKMQSKEELIMQNKPNFLNTKNNLNFSNNNDYELRTTNYELFKNEPNQSQSVLSEAKGFMVSY